MKRYLPKGWIAVFKRELRLISGRSTYSLVLVILPLVAITLITLLFSKGVPRDLPIAVVDYDNSTLSRKLIRMIDAAPAPWVQYIYREESEAIQLLQRHEIYGYVIIPEDFSGKIIKGQNPEVEFSFNNSFMVAGGMLNKDVATVVSTFSTGVDYNQKLKRGVKHKKAMALSMPVMPDNRMLFNPYGNYFYYLTTAFLPITLLMFILSGTIYAIGSEFKYSRAGEWISLAQGSIFRALTAKLFLYVVVYSILMVFVQVLIFVFHKTPLNGNIFILAYAAILFVLAYVAMGIFIVSLFPSLRMALSVAAVYSALAFTMSGLTFPHSAMYKSITLLAQAFPFTHYLKIFLDQSLRGAPISSSLGPMIGLNVFLFLPLIVLPRLKKLCYSPQHWGKS